MKPLNVLYCLAVCGLAGSLSGQKQNMAISRPVTTSGPTWPGYPATNLTDGKMTTMSHPQAQEGTEGFYYEIDLGEEYELETIVVSNRSNCCPERLTRYRVSLFGAGDTTRETPNWTALIRSDGSNSGKGGKDRVAAGLHAEGRFIGQYIRVINTTGDPYNPQLAEVEAYVDVGDEGEVGERSADVTLVPGHGFMEEPFQLSMTAGFPGVEIRYTTDGQEPTRTTGQVYSGLINISGTTVVRAAAFEEGKAGSRVVTQSYIFKDQVIASDVMDAEITAHAEYGPKMDAALSRIPTMIITTGPPINGNAETRGSLEFLPTDGGKGFQVNAGIRYFGGAFTNFAKKNFRIYFRGQYGVSKLEYPLFEGFDRGIEPTRQFDQINLRAGSHDMSQRGFYMSNRFTDDSMLEMGHLNPHGRFVHLYLNGTYWGMYHLRERWNADLLADYLGGEPEDYESINGNWNVGGWADPGDPYDGDGSAWTRIKSLRDNYEEVRTYLDVPNYIDYMLLFMYGRTEAEYRCVGPVGEGSGFKFFLNDSDGFLRTRAGNRTARDAPGRKNGDGPGSIFSMLHKEGHPDYLILLADRIHKHLFNDGALTTARNIARLEYRTSEVELAFIAEAARWGYRSPSSWASTRDKVIKDLLSKRTASLISNLRSAGFYRETDAPVASQHGGMVATGFELNLAARVGSTIHYTTDGSDPRLAGGAVSPVATGFPMETETASAPVSIHQNTWVKARALYNGEWSALTDAFFWIQRPVTKGDIVVSELHYHPRDNEQMEFLELQNVSGRAINLRGARFSSGIRYTFSNMRDTIIPAGGRYLLAKSRFDMQKTYGADFTVDGVYHGSLSNKGEELVLVDVNGGTLVRLKYSDSAPWPEAADGDGPSLVFHVPGSAPDDPSAWGTGQSQGTPGVGEARRYMANPGLDLDGNGYPDLFDYALGRDKDGRINFPSLEVAKLAGDATPDRIVTYITFQNTLADDLSFVPEYSMDLQNWIPLSELLDPGETRILDAGILELNWSKPIPAQSAPPTFFRLRIEER